MTMSRADDSDGKVRGEPAGIAAVSSDVEFLRGLLSRAQRRVDPHAFHVVPIVVATTVGAD